MQGLRRQSLDIGARGAQRPEPPLQRPRGEISQRPGQPFGLPGSFRIAIRAQRRRQHGFPGPVCRQYGQGDAQPAEFGAVQMLEQRRVGILPALFGGFQQAHARRGPR